MSTERHNSTTKFWKKLSCECVRSMHNVGRLNFASRRFDDTTTLIVWVQNTSSWGVGLDVQTFADADLR